MSVALIIEKVNGVEKNDYLPISTQQFFVENWMPLCELYNLKWVPLFKTGFAFNEKDLPFLLEELAVVKVHLTNAGNEYLKERINMLIAKLETLKGKESTFFIG